MRFETPTWCTRGGPVDRAAAWTPSRPALRATWPPSRRPPPLGKRGEGDGRQKVEVAKKVLAGWTRAPRPRVGAGRGRAGCHLRSALLTMKPYVHRQRGRGPVGRRLPEIDNRPCPSARLEADLAEPILPNEGHLAMGLEESGLARLARAYKLGLQSPPPANRNARLTIPVG
ncbi:MAG: hypothetical protein ACLT98_10635 [Eggerthellaceae bacterium]